MVFASPDRLKMISPIVRTGVVLVAMAAASVFPAHAQQVQEQKQVQAGDPPSDAATVKALVDRLNELETRVNDLEAERAALLAKRGDAAAESSSMAAITPAPQAPASTAAMPQDSMVDHPMPPGTETTGLHPQIHGFADINWDATNQHQPATLTSPPSTSNSFRLGQFNLFITSKMSDHFSALSEVVTEADPISNEFDVDLERLLVTYHGSDYFNLSMGRGHSAIGWYNTEYHHSTWLQTAVGRPKFIDFEDSGGILPVHYVGVSASGMVPSGALGLHYVVDVSNGMSAQAFTLGTNPVQNVHDEHNGKAVNFAVYARPDALPNFQTGFSIYRDKLTPLLTPNINETILSAHAIYQSPTFEFLNEVVLERHALVDGSPAINIPAWYTQVSKLWGKYRPYVRYQYMNVPSRDPIYGVAGPQENTPVGLQQGPSLGLRCDVSEFAAFKIQYDRNVRNLEPDFNTLETQMSFAF